MSVSQVRKNPNQAKTQQKYCWKYTQNKNNRKKDVTAKKMELLNIRKSALSKITFICYIFINSQILVMLSSTEGSTTCSSCRTTSTKSSKSIQILCKTQHAIMQANSLKKLQSIVIF